MTPLTPFIEAAIRFAESYCIANAAALEMEKGHGGTAYPKWVVASELHAKYRGELWELWKKERTK